MVEVSAWTGSGTKLADVDFVHGLLKIFKRGSCAVQIVQLKESSKVFCAPTMHMEFQEEFPCSMLRFDSPVAVSDN